MSCKSCIASSIGCLIFSFIIVGIPILIYAKIVKPKDPTFTLDNASVTGFNLTSDGHLTAFFDVEIRADNRNHKLKLHYSDVRVSIFKNKQQLAEDALDSFTQRKRNVTLLKSEVVALDVKLKQSPMFDFQFESGLGYLDFDVFMTATLDGDNLEVNCRHAIVNITAPSFVASSPKGSNSSNEVNKDGFRSIGCSVLIYSNDAD